MTDFENVEEKIENTEIEVDDNIIELSDEEKNEIIGGAKCNFKYRSCTTHKNSIDMALTGDVYISTWKNKSGVLNTNIRSNKKVRFAKYQKSWKGKITVQITMANKNKTKSYINTYYITFE